MKVLVTGDYCDKNRVSTFLAQKKYKELFGNIKPIVDKADYSITNFEFPIVNGEGDPIKKCGPNLKGQKEAVGALLYAGFDCCTLANNHILDQGEKCAIETKHLLSKEGIDTVGFGSNLNDAELVLYKTIAERKLAIINCCENEFSIATETSAGANALNPVKLFYSIREAREKADHVLVIIHGGHEHYNLPSTRMVELYHFIIDTGADAVINHHQHCYSGYEIYNNRPIFYGLGNFLFDNPKFRNSFWNEGYMVMLNFELSSISFELIPYKQCNDEVTVHLMRSEEINSFKKSIDKLNEIIANKNRLMTELSKYYTHSSRYEMSLLEPYSGKIFSKLMAWNVLPKFIKGKKMLSILNHIACESHRDKLLFALNSFK